MMNRFENTILFQAVVPTVLIALMSLISTGGAA
jgi:hypothetical protein